MKEGKKAKSKSKEETEPNTYCCPKCHLVPSLKIKVDAELEIKCQCNQNKKWNSTIDNFMTTMTNKEEEKRLCEYTHKKMVPALFYCQTCETKMCLSCLLQHNEQNGDHISYLIGQNNMERTCYLCFDEDEESSFFCVNCGIQICNKCIGKHQSEQKDHIILSIEYLMDNENYVHFKDQLDKFSKRLEEDRIYCEQLIDKMEKFLKEMKDIYRKRIKKNNEILSYFNILNVAYLSHGTIPKEEDEDSKESKDIYQIEIKPDIKINPNIINNLVNQNMADLLSAQRKDFFKDFIDKVEEVKAIFDSAPVDLNNIKMMNPFNEEQVNNGNGVNDLIFLGKVKEKETISGLPKVNGKFCFRTLCLRKDNSILSSTNNHIFISKLNDEGEYSYFHSYFTDPDYYIKINKLELSKTDDNFLFLICFKEAVNNQNGLFRIFRGEELEYLTLLKI